MLLNIELEGGILLRLETRMLDPDSIVPILSGVTIYVPSSLVVVG